MRRCAGITISCLLLVACEQPSGVPRDWIAEGAPDEIAERAVGDDVRPGIRVIQSPRKPWSCPLRRVPQGKLVIYASPESLHAPEKPTLRVVLVATDWEAAAGHPLDVECRLDWERVPESPAWMSCEIDVPRDIDKARLDVYFGAGVSSRLLLSGAPARGARAAAP